MLFFTLKEASKKVAMEVSGNLRVPVAKTDANFLAHIMIRSMGIPNLLFYNWKVYVFSVKTEKMIWAGATRSVNPESRGELVNEAAGLIMKDMKKAGFL